MAESQLAPDNETLARSTDETAALDQYGHPLTCIESGRSHYSNEDRRNVVALYMVHGKARMVSKMTGVDETVICRWRQTPWWQEACQAIASEVDDEVRAQLRRTTIAAQDKVLAKIDAGEGSVKDLAIVASIAIDKLRLLDGKPTRITDNSRGDTLAAQLAKLSAQVNAKVVSEQ